MGIVACDSSGLRHNPCVQSFDALLRSDRRQTSDHRDSVRADGSAPRHSDIYNEPLWRGEGCGAYAQIRPIPYILIGCALLGCGYYLSTTGLPVWVSLFYIGAAVAAAVNLIVNFWWKISAHGAGMGGFIAMIMLMNRYGLPHYNLWIWCIGAVLAGGLLGMARVWLGRHTPMQTVAGEVSGIICVLAMQWLMPLQS